MLLVCSLFISFWALVRDLYYFALIVGYWADMGLWLPVMYWLMVSGLIRLSLLVE